MLVAKLYQVLVVWVVWICIASQRPHYSHFLRAVKLLQSRYRVQKKSEDGRHELDLRGHRIFHSSAQQECCPTLSHLSEHKAAVNSKGMLLELYHTPNFTQKFYETVCDSNYKDQTCQFVAPRYRTVAKCRQQFSYVYALGRTHGNSNAEYKIDYIRVKTGCKCVLNDSTLAG